MFLRGKGRYRTRTRTRTRRVGAKTPSALVTPLALLLPFSPEQTMWDKVCGRVLAVKRKLIGEQKGDHRRTGSGGTEK